MPSCFALTRKGEKEPTALSKIDAELCELLGVEVHPQFYVAGWFDCIGFLIATNNDCRLGSEQLRTKVTDWFADGYNVERKDDMLRMLAYLEEHYSSNGWYEMSR